MTGGKVGTLLGSERGREIFRFLVTGATNTIVGFLMFAAVQFLIGRYVTYIGSLLIGHLLTSLVAFALYRRFVFRATNGNVFGQFLRFQTVYIVPLAVNIVLLPILVQAFAINVYVAQGAATLLIAVGSYFAHRYFSFRERPTRPSTERPRGTRSR